ncbi:hypothetical protein [Halalkalicoccus salilacus]|uniref:hypothetical protein n=1 Tax=Halalkalicoccus sp. GCM10025704 TaxID=3252662 RepID=UPI0036147CD2
MGYEERIYYGWVVVGACFLGSFVVFGLSYSFGVFFEAILTEFGHPRGVTSVAFGVQSLMLYLGAVGIGVLVDRYGTRRMLALGGSSSVSASSGRVERSRCSRSCSPTAS